MAMRVQNYNFKLVNIECLPTSVNFNVLVELDTDIEDLLPYIAARLPGCTYIHGSKVVNYQQKYHIITFRPRELTITRVKGKDEARHLCKYYVDFINDTERLRPKIEPVYMKKVEIGPLDVFKFLPGTNCGECGYPTCLAFAAMVVKSEASVRRCVPLFTHGNPDAIHALVLKLQEAGISTEEEFPEEGKNKGVMCHE